MFDLHIIDSDFYGQISKYHWHDIHQSLYVNVKVVESICEEDYPWEYPAYDERKDEVKWLGPDIDLCFLSFLMVAYHEDYCQKEYEYE